MKHIRQTVCGFVKAHLTRFLLLAVLLTAGFSMRYAAQAKYTLYVSDHTSAVADNFAFTSNYLGAEGAGTQYSIGSWAGRNYSVQVDIRNFENALIYNDTDTDVYYYMSAVMYTDTDDDGQLTEADSEDATYTASFTYPAGSVTGTYQMDDGTSTPCCLLPGMSEFNRVTGTQSVGVSVTSAFTQTQRHFLVVKAHTIPLSDITANRVTLPEGSTYQYTTTRGVFETIVEGTFILNVGGSAADVSATMSQSNTEYTVVYKLTTGEITGGITTTVEIFFDSRYLEASSTMTVESVTGESNIKKVSVTMNSNDMKNLYFFKKSISTTIVDGGENNENNGRIYWQRQQS